MVGKLLKYAIYVGLAAIALAGMAAITNQGVKPIWVLLGVVSVPILLYGLVVFPAAFVIPALFATRDIALPFNPYRHVFNPTTAELAAGLLAAAVLFRLVRLWSQQKAVPLNDLFRGQGKGVAAYFALVAIVTISYLYTRAPDYGAAKLLSILTIGTLIFFTPFLLLNEERDFDHFVLSIVGLAIVLGLLRIRAGSAGIYGAHEEPTHIGVGQLIGMAILLVLYYKFSEEPWVKKLALFSLPVLAAGLIASETRGALFSLLFVLLGSVFLREKPASLVSPAALLAGVALIFVALLVFPKHWLSGEAASKFHAKTLEVVDIVEGKSTDEGSGGRRLVFYDAALEGIEQKPLLGWGVGGWATYYWHNDMKEYPHNLFLEVTIEQGLVGLIPFVALILIGLKAAKRVFVEASGKFAFVLPVLVYCVCTVMTSGDLDDCRYLCFWCAVAFVARRIVESNQNQQEERQMATALAE